ncbi:MAG: 3'(2'),5'-bisphosphate nucleotidase CysQ [Bacteroidota bacterium]|nr:3'(2'),5'-bisphosphate nucleotidase CysQ [Bacteroidota bacterium]
MNLDLLFETAVNAIVEASEAIMDIYRHSDHGIQYKPDDSPVTKADLEASAIIFRHLEKTGIPIICEEREHYNYDTRKNWKYFWLVDPLDGTKEFIKKNDEFTVNIALIEEDTPIMGLISIPALNSLYWGIKHSGSFKCKLSKFHTLSIHEITKVAVKLPVEKPGERLRIMISRSHPDPETQKFIDNLKAEHPGLETSSAGSSLKFCYIAEGKADLYLRFSPTMEWDTAAGQAIVEAAGVKMVTLPAQTKFVYNKPELKNPGFMVTR